MNFLRWTTRLTNDADAISYACFATCPCRLAVCLMMGLLGESGGADVVSYLSRNIKK